MTTDAIIISYPKSGRTWLRQIFECAGASVAAEHAGSGTNGPHVGRHYRQLAFKHYKYTKSKVVFMHRHPIDTAVSNFWQMHKRELPRWSNFRLFLMRLRKRLPPDSIDEFVLSPRYGVEKICVYNLQWSELLAPRQDVLFTSYERLSANPAAEVARLLAFVRPDLQKHADIDEIVRKSSFREMQKVEISQPKHALTGPESLKVRRGKVGGYTDELTAETIKQAKEIMARMSYEQRLHDFA
jgi:hypothetical protein